MAKTSRLGQKQCPQCKMWIKGTRSKTCPYCKYEFRLKQKAAKVAVVKPAPAPTPAVVERPNNGSTITLDLVKKVAHTVKAMGGFSKMTEVLAVIKEAGGVKKFRDLAEAITVTEPDVVI
jgi:uncharacterized Zn finger protein (UPF0148 family)